jgi:excisionase family DNA binding protein
MTLHSPQGSLDQLRAAARTTPPATEFSEQLLATLGKLFASVEEVRSLVSHTTKDFYTVDEVCEVTGRAPYTVRRWIKEGRITATRVEGTGPKGRLLIARSELAKLIKAGLADHLTEITAGQ